MSYPSPATRRLQRQAAEIFADDTLTPARKLVAVGKLLKDLRRIKAVALGKAMAIDKAYFEETGRNRPRRYSAVYREKQNPEPPILPMVNQLHLAEAVLRADIRRKSKAIASQLQISEAQVNAIRTEIRRERGELPPHPGVEAIKAMAAEIRRQQQQETKRPPPASTTTARDQPDEHQDRTSNARSRRSHDLPRDR